MHDSRLIDLLPPESAVAIGIEGVCDLGLQFALRQTGKQRLHFGSDFLEIISESFKRHASEFAALLKISERAINHNVSVQTLQRGNRARRQDSIIACFSFAFWFSDRNFGCRQFYPRNRLAIGGCRGQDRNEDNGKR